ncbi:MAG: hypothetical protein N2109_11645 [Fimbriimonadales bacterium]|nr:hypothetical protein [Fimbriimonadales bacterium]
MSAAPHLDPRPQPEDNVLYVAPPWAVRRSPVALWRGVLDFLLFELKVLVAIVWTLATGYYLLPELYALKTRWGIDLLPGRHAPDLLPFLDRSLPEDPPGVR